MTSIAIIGTSGNLGSFVLNELQDPKYEGKVQYPVKAISSQDKSSESTEKIKYIQAKVADTNSGLASELKGTDVIISLTPPLPEVLNGLEALVKEVKPKLYIPSEFGCENDVVESEVMFPGNAVKVAHNDKVKEYTKVVPIYTALFRIPPVFLYGLVAHVGVDKDNKTVTYIENEDVEFPFSTGPDIAKVIVTIATTDPAKVLPKYRVYSGFKKVKEIVAEAQKETGSSFKSEIISLDDAKQAYLKTVEAGTPNIVPFLFYVTFAGPGKGMVFAEDEREAINPNESLWKWSSW